MTYYMWLGIRLADNPGFIERNTVLDPALPDASAIVARHRATGRLYCTCRAFVARGYNKTGVACRHITFIQSIFSHE
jgi:hypothetical protein